MNKNNNINNNHMEWFIGFFDAEGNFQRTVEKRVTKRGDIYYKIAYSFHISLSLVDKELLYEIKDFLGMGRIYLGRQQSYCIEVSSKKDLTTLIDFIENKHSKSSFITLKGNKRKQFRVWLELFNKKHQETK